ncbi:phage tail protein [Hymenobacter yonginensis]|uniref:Tail fiber protein n=1 Tax=Hymenobacter yonginensis TaxID=748197 RepID=A0ABY7PV22_9BACT|nr:tail fiber protein [Hymenobacter yonginensis]WBO86756.1 tail fiber protein [Hymenobacter yonginensis]
MDEYLGIIKLFAGNFAPRGWALCNGQLLSITQNTALFSILGTVYGGDGQTTFALPNLQSRVPVGAGQGAGLSFYSQGELGGTETVTLTLGQMPAHSHGLNASTAAGTTDVPTGNVLAQPAGATGSGDSVTVTSYATGTATTALNPTSVSASGSSQPHENRPPFLAMNYIICTEGLFPSRS